ncbi:c-type cytochrome biogenesis protein CcmI [Pseudooceanicola aestuarii]|uniref:c-type cytochrome biogenesis protein CcmI n=1 Tax=Pseudooceanicola aestuarii TaxID=2697319 RepID=UPI001EF94BB7|nr:c-type cytochrome biogenesis protein CcmI [Pseudooceanicola aestuarii]
MPTMLFWVIIAALCLGVAAVLARALLQGGEDDGPTSAAAFDVAVYRDQLAEVDRDLARGTLPQAEGDRLRTEISRRLLAADARARAGADAGPATTTAHRWPALLAAGAVVAGAASLYLMTGAPGYGDLPRADRLAAAQARLADRPSQAEAEDRLPEALAIPGATPSQEFTALMEKLRQAVADRPDDLQGLRLLARNEATLGNFTAAHQAQARVLELTGPEASSRDFADHADMMILAAGGYVSPAAERSLRTALSRDPDDGVANYYFGLLMNQVGRPDVAFRLWDRLLRRGPADAPWIAAIRSQIPDVAADAGRPNYTLPISAEPLAGPSLAEMEAAQDMDDADRAAMIRGMVDSLSDRLARQGGSAAEWARLITALGVLDETAQARAIHAEAQKVFAARPAELDQVDAAARRAGVLQ